MASDQFSSGDLPVHADRSRRLVAGIVRFSLGVAILGFLVWMNRGSIAQLRAQQFRGEFLAAALAIVLGATLLTFVRWYLLVIAQGLAFRFRDALRLGFIGFLFSQIIFGAVSGDLVKVVMLAREQSRRTVAIATVVLDRLVGLYGLTLVAGLAALGSWSQIRQVDVLGEIVPWLVVVVAAGTGGFAILLLPIWRRSSRMDMVARIPVVGPVVRELLGAIQVYRGKLGIVLLSVLLSVAAHVGFVTSLYCVALALEGPGWPVGVHYVLAPLGLMINAIPLAPGGLGVGEAAMQTLFSSVGQDGTRAFLMMLGFRATFWVTSLVGVGYLVSGFSEARRAMAEAESSAST